MKAARISAVMDRARAWLERVPAPDPAARRAALILQVCLGVITAWILAGMAVAAAGGGAPALLAPPALAVEATVPCALAALALLRRGRLRAALWAFLVPLGACTAGVLVAGGLGYGLHLLRGLPFLLALPVLFLGRRAAWLALAAAALVLALAGARDAGLMGGVARAAWLPPLGVPGGMIVYALALTVLIDQYARWLRDGLTATLLREREAREGEARLKAVFATFPDAIALSRFQPDGPLVWVNDGFTELTGWPAAEAVDRPASALGLWAEPEAQLRFRELVLSTRPVKSFEALVRRKDGSTLVGLLSARVVTVGGEAFALVMTRDITDRKRSEALRAQLEQAQKMEAVGRLASGVAHDFNNLLSVVRSCADVAAGELPAGHPAREEVEAIGAAAERGTALTRQLLDLGRKQAGAGARADAGEAVARVCALLPRVLGARVQLRSAVEPALGAIPLLPVQLEQVLLNLAINARDAMPEGGELTLDARQRRLQDGELRGLVPGAYVTIEVRDTGTGMSEAVRARLFEPLFTTKPAGVGTGLGLATSQDIVRQAGGAIQVETAPGVGSSFTVWLPAVAEGEGAPAVS